MQNGEINYLCCFKQSGLCNGVDMGSSQSSKTENTPFVELPRDHNVRASIRTKVPMPDQNELERRFTKVLASMDLPADKAKLLKQYDNEKKWEIICDQELVQAKDPPSHYLSKLRTYLDPKASRSSRKRKMVGDATSTQVLRDLEISLRTNHIEWVREFLNDENHGLDSLIEYLSFRLVMMRHEQLLSESRTSSSERISPTSNGTCIGAFVGSGGTSAIHNGTMTRPSLDLLDSPSIRRQSKHAAKLKMGDTKDDIHVCIMCLRAIMNNKYGFNMVIQHTEAINSIALSLAHKSLRTKALVLELLAAICLVKGGHEIILSAFDNFKEICQEKRRFQTLMDYFINYEIFHIEFMVACMQFVNIVVHSVEDMNFRVHLQYEFSKLGLDDYLDKLKHTESEELQVQISAYLDNVFDVAALMEDSETRTAALEKVAELEDELAQAHDRLAELERESMAQITAFESALGAAKEERNEILESKRSVEVELATLRREVKDHKQESRSRQSILEDKIKELTGGSLPSDSSSTGVSSCSSSSSSTSSGNCVSPSIASCPAPPPPPPPPLPALNTPFAPPPPPPPPAFRLGIPCIPGVNQALDGAMTIKPIVRTKYKLPTLTWTALKPNQVRGTIFNELDDDKVFPVIDFGTFEEKFKLSFAGQNFTDGQTDVDGLSRFPSKKFKKPDNVSLLEHTRLRNLAISRRKIQLPVDKIISAINSLDLKQVSVENVEILQRMIPTEQEIKLYRDYVNEKRDVNVLTEEDKFLLQLSRVERITNKLSIMNYIGNFMENIHIIAPQVHAIISASKAVKNSGKLPRILEIILAFGNYMNSGQRGRAYGFKLHCLDSLVDTKSTDKRLTLLNYIAETVRSKFPDLLNFDSELMLIDKSSAVSLESILIDLTDLEKNMELVKKEFEMRSKERPPGPSVNVLKEFLSSSDERLKNLRADTKLAQDSYRECVEYFGESIIGTDTNHFFSLLLRFIRDFKKADQENEQRKKLQQAAQYKSQNTLKHDKLNQKKQQDAVINELKNKARLVQEKKLLHQDEVYNGALEDILLGLKSEPYRRADAVRRSQRRRIDSNRLSRTMEQFEL